MSDQQNKLLMLGLPESGKTSFLAAFVNYVDSEIPTKKLRQYQLSSNAAYINLIVQTYLKGEKQERTKLTSNTTPNTSANIFLEELNDKFRFTLHIPDVFGEIFESQFVDRFIDENYMNQIKSASGILLFIHPKHLREAVLIEDIKEAHEFENLVNQESTSKEIKESDVKEGDKKSNNEAAEFNAIDSPTQIILIDLLESHLEFLSKLPIKLSVIVSAWDEVIKDNDSISPMKWLEKILPMLYQYLITNQEKIYFKTYGISAVGGNLDEQTTVDRLTAMTEPTDRILVQEEGEPHKNIAAPIEWIIKEWQQEIA